MTDLSNTAGISLRVQGEAAINGVFRRLEDPARRLRLSERLAAYGLSSTEERFESQVAPDGTPWKPSERAKTSGGKTLVKTPRLAVSFSPFATKDEAGWGTNVLYARIHQFGGVILPKNKAALSFRLASGAFVSASKVTMPARPMLGVNDYDRQRLAGIAMRWGQEAISS